MSNRDLNSIGPLGNVELESGLSLVPRIKLLLTILRADKAVTAIDEWKVKRSLIEYFKSLHSVSVPEEDLEIQKFKDMKKRKREDPVARGTLVIRDLGFLSKVLGVKKQAEDGGESYEEVEKKFLEWRKDVVQKMDGMELNLEGTKFKLSVALPASDDFEGMKKEWEEISAFGIPG